jgi:hypothetical protein
MRSYSKRKLAQYMQAVGDEEPGQELMMFALKLLIADHENSRACVGPTSSPSLCRVPSDDYSIPDDANAQGHTEKTLPDTGSSADKLAIGCARQSANRVKNCGRPSGCLSPDVLEKLDMIPEMLSTMRAIQKRLGIDGPSALVEEDVQPENMQIRRNDLSAEGRRSDSPRRYDSLTATFVYAPHLSTTQSTEGMNGRLPSNDDQDGQPIRLHTVTRPKSRMPSSPRTLTDIQSTSIGAGGAGGLIRSCRKSTHDSSGLLQPPASRPPVAPSDEGQITRPDEGTITETGTASEHSGSNGVNLAPLQAGKLQMEPEQLDRVVGNGSYPRVAGASASAMTDAGLVILEI